MKIRITAVAGLLAAASLPAAAVEAFSAQYQASTLR